MNQRIVGTSRNDTLRGGDGDETFDGWGGSDVVDGGAGDDILIGTQNVAVWPDGADTLIGGGGNDLFQFLAAHSSIEGGEGDDTVWAPGDVLIDAGPGNDSVEAFAGSSVAVGPGRDVIVPRFLAQIPGAPGAPDAPTLVTDFDPGPLGDRLDIARLLQEGVVGYTGGNLVGAGYLRLWQDGADTVLDLDPDGGGDGFGPLLRLSGVSVGALTAANLGFDPDAATPLIATTRGGIAGAEHAARYKGPVSYLEYAFLGRDAGEAVGGSGANDFINLRGGDDAADGGVGDDVIDGGSGSNFLTGGGGRDVFFLDGRGGQTTWTTITDWQEGEELSIWGYRPGISHNRWVRNDGAEGYRGVTLHLDLDGDGATETSITWAGMNWERPPVPDILGVQELLWFH